MVGSASVVVVIVVFAVAVVLGSAVEFQFFAVLPVAVVWIFQCGILFLPRCTLLPNASPS